MKRAVSLVLALSLVTVACGNSDSAPSPFPEDAFAFAASSDLAVGSERLLVAVSDGEGSRLPSPDIPVSISVRLQGRDGSETADADFIWAIPDVSGLYKIDVDFDAPGVWLVVATPEGGDPLEEFAVQVNEIPFTVAVGEPAPRSETPTVDDAPLAEISSDPSPNPALYQMSVAEAVTSGRPSVIAFATPRFCQTAICGPTLDTIEQIVPEHPEANFVHVEVFTNLDDPENLEVVPAIVEWGLPTEPWVFVVGADGLVKARFEGVVAPEEISTALG